MAQDLLAELPRMAGDPSGQQHGQWWQPAPTFASRVRRRVFRTVAVSAMASVLMLMSTPAAVAINTHWVEYGENRSCADRTQAVWTFESHANWDWNNGLLKARFELAFDDWANDVERWSGGYLLSEGGANWTARWDDLGSSGSLARTVCYPWPRRDIEFNTWKIVLFQNDLDLFESVAAHEWGHAFGLDHVGEKDASAGGPPTMTTCTSDNTRWSLSSDDEAAITAQNERVNGYWTITANSSFEENEFSHIGWWRTTSNVARFQAWSSGGGVDDSPWYAIFKGDGTNNPAVFQDTYITWKVGGNVKGRANYKKWNSADSGIVKVTSKYQIWRRSGSGCGGLNDNAVVDSQFHAKNAYCTPTTTWKFCDPAPQWVDGAQDRVLRVRIVVYNRMTVTIDGQTIPQYVRIDRVRATTDDHNAG